MFTIEAKQLEVALTFAYDLGGPVRAKRRACDVRHDSLEQRDWVGSEIGQYVSLKALTLLLVDREPDSSFR